MKKSAKPDGSWRPMQKCSKRPEALGAVQGRAADVVDAAEHEAALHGLVVHVVGDPLGEVLALPRAVDPVRVAAVPTTDVERYGEPRLDLERRPGLPSGVVQP